MTCIRKAFLFDAEWAGQQSRQAMATLLVVFCGRVWHNSAPERTRLFNKQPVLRPTGRKHKAIRAFS